jgi:hypothetical protein
VLDAVTSEVGPALRRRDGRRSCAWNGVQDEVVVVTGWNGADAAPVEQGSLYHPDPEGATLAVLETGIASRAEEWSPERGTCSVIAAPVIVGGAPIGALTASRPAARRFPAGAEIRLRSFADLAAQSIAQRARPGRAARIARADRPQPATRPRRASSATCTTARSSDSSRCPSPSRLASAAFRTSPEKAGELLAGATDELDEALESCALSGAASIRPP